MNGLFSAPGRLKEDLAIAHQVGRTTGTGFALSTLLLVVHGADPAGWLLCSLLFYALAAGLALAAPYLLGEELMAAVARALLQHARALPRPLVVPALSQRQAVYSAWLHWLAQRLVCSHRRCLMAGVPVAVKSSRPFALFPLAPLLIP